MLFLCKLLYVFRVGGLLGVVIEVVVKIEVTTVDFQGETSLKYTTITIKTMQPRV